MITDAQNRPSLAQSLIATNATVLSTDSIDLLTANRNLGRAYPLRVHAVLTAALAGGTSVQAQIITSANANLTSPTVIGTEPAVITANGVIGAKILDRPISGTAQRYLGVQYIVVGVMSAGAATAHVVAETDNMPYPAMNTGL